MVGRQVEFITYRTNLTFERSLLKEAAAKWAISFTERNDPVLDNYQDFLHKLKGHFGNPIKRSKSQRIKEIQNHKQGQRRVRAHIPHFKLFVGNLQ